ncbi:hypothetical protein JW962_00610 [Candidatus Dojkabacteria bacterium]|nr:hypothetical protein [Candidatus Dojkabacteria bacterium]
MATIFIHSDPDITKARVTRYLSRKLKINKEISLDQNTLPDIHILLGTESIKINEIKKLMDDLSFKPMQLSKQFGIIMNAHMMTPTAQNALLKNLEEHPDSTEYILTTQDIHLLLPTIISRCRVKYVKKAFHKTEIPDVCKEFNSSPKYRKLLIVKEISDQKDSNVVFSFLTGLLRLSQEDLSSKKLNVATPNIKLVQFVQNYIKQNVNKALALDYLVIHWKRI